MTISNVMKRNLLLLMSVLVSILVAVAVFKATKSFTYTYPIASVAILLILASIGAIMAGDADGILGCMILFAIANFFIAGGGEGTVSFIVAIVYALGALVSSFMLLVRTVIEQ